MKRLSLAMLVVLGLVLTFTPLISAYAEELPAYIRFKGHALGTCGVGRTLGGGLDAIYIGGGVGSGNMVVNGYAKATSYQELPLGTGDYFQIYGEAYFTAPEGYVRAAGSIAVRWFENNELHQLMVSIHSKPTSLGVFQPETDKFLAGASFTGPLPYEEQMLGYKGTYKIGSNVRHLSGPIGVWASRFENPDAPEYGIEFIHVVLIYDEMYVIHIAWASEPLSIPNPAGGTFTLPAAKILVHDVKLL